MDTKMDRRNWLQILVAGAATLPLSELVLPRGLLAQELTFAESVKIQKVMSLEYDNLKKVIATLNAKDQMEFIGALETESMKLLKNTNLKKDEAARQMENEANQIARNRLALKDGEVIKRLSIDLQGDKPTVFVTLESDSKKSPLTIDDSESVSKLVFLQYLRQINHHREPESVSFITSIIDTHLTVLKALHVAPK